MELVSPKAISLVVTGHWATSQEKQPVLKCDGRGVVLGSFLPYCLWRAQQKQTVTSADTIFL